MSWRALVFLSLLACEPLPPTPPAHRASEQLISCNASSVRITSIEHALEVINALPKPVDGPCFVAALPRPLKLVASSSVVSAQPSFSRESPRMFLMLDGLVATVVPEGDGARVLEFGQWSSQTRTIKGEIDLPVTGALPLDAAYTHVASMRMGTNCGLCHTAEREEKPGVFSSVAYRPQKREEISVGALRAQHDACVADGGVDGACAMFHALFDFGPVEQGAFSAEIRTFGP